MTDSMNPVAAGIWNKLKADGTLMTALSGTLANGYKCFHIIAPQGTTFPYITFGQITNIPIGTFKNTSAIEDESWWFNVFSKVGSTDAGDILDALTDVLDDTTLTVTGYTNLVCSREYVGAIRYTPETGTYQIPARYKIWIDKN